MKKLLFSYILISLFHCTSLAQAPNWLWAKSPGGKSICATNSITTDKNNDIIITGTYEDTTIIFGTDTLTNVSGNNHTFIVKYNSIGDVLWAKSSGGNYRNEGLSITTDVNNDIIITGDYRDTVIFGIDTLTSNSNIYDFNTFVVKYNSSGDVLWAKSAKEYSYSSVSYDSGESITTDADSNIIIIGNFAGPPIIFGNDTLNNTILGTSSDIFVVKYNSSGDVLWAKSAGGSGYDYGKGITTDTDNNILITGCFNSNRLIFGTDTLIKTTAPGSDRNTFIVKYDTSGNVLWAKSSGGNSNGSSNSITTDKNNNVVILGYFADTTIIFGTYTLTNVSGNTQTYIVKYNSLGDVLWAKNPNTKGYCIGNSIATDVSNNIITTGEFKDTTIIFGTDTITNLYPNYLDIFIVKYNSIGNVLWVKSIDGNREVVGNCITTDANNDIIVAGNFCSSTLSFGIDTITNAGNCDIFIAKLAGSMGIIENNVKEEVIKIFPNPVTDNFQIQTSLKIKNIEITDITRRTILTTTNKTIDCSSFAKGVYFVKVKTENGEAVEKFIKL